MATPVVVPVVAPPKSWLSRVGHDILVVLHIVAKDAVPIAAVAGTFVEALAPALTPLVTVAENLLTKIANSAAITEAAFSAVGQASNGAAKLQAVLNAVGPEMDAWITNQFPGAGKLDDVRKAGLINAVVAILNQLDPKLALTLPTAAIAAAAAANSAQTASIVQGGTIAQPVAH